MEHPNFAKRHPLSNKVDVNLDVLGAAMLHWIGGHVDGGYIVTINQCGGAKRAVQFLKELP